MNTRSDRNPEAGGTKHGRLLWLVAVVITLGAAVFQRAVGPTTAVPGRVNVGSERVRYMLPRSHGGEDPCRISISLPDSTITGALMFRRYKTDDQWTRQPMRWEKGHRVGVLPHQPPGGKMVYRVFLSPPATVTGGATTEIISTSVGVPASGPLVLRFRGAVPAAIMIPHILFMFFGMLWANRAGIEAFRPDSARGGGRGLLRYSLWALVLLVGGGLVLGPAVQWYSFGQAWTGYPYGTDLTDNKTLIAVLAWIVAVGAVLLLRRASSAAAESSPGRRTLQRAAVLFAALVTLLIFAIPHSVRGTELDYSKQPPSTAPIG